METRDNLKEFDPVKFLNSESDIQAFLEEAIKSGASHRCLSKCIEDAALAKGLGDFAKKLGISAQQLYEHLHNVDTSWTLDNRIMERILEGFQKKLER